MPQHEMQKIRVEKVTVNIGIGHVGDDVEKAVTLLKKLTGENPVKTTATEEARQFGLRPGLNIGAKVTLRGETAEEFLARVLAAQDNEVPAAAFDRQGNFSLGVDEYIDMPDTRYDPDIGMQGFEVAVTLERPGYRVKKRKDPRDLGKQQKITPEDAQEFVRDRFDVEIV